MIAPMSCPTLLAGLHGHRYIQMPLVMQSADDTLSMLSVVGLCHQAYLHGIAIAGDVAGHSVGHVLAGHDHGPV